MCISSEMQAEMYPTLSSLHKKLQNASQWIHLQVVFGYCLAVDGLEDEDVLHACNLDVEVRKAFLTEQPKTNAHADTRR